MMSTHKSIRNSENAVHETQNHHLVGTYRLGEKYINILNEKSYIATISLPILYRRAVFALQNPPFCSVKEPVLMCKRHCFDAQDRLLGTTISVSPWNVLHTNAMKKRKPTSRLAFVHLHNFLYFISSMKTY